MSKSTLKFLGRSSGFGLKNNSAYYEDGNRLVLIDCGLTVFNTVRETVDLSKYETIDIIITHLHPDHAGSLGQLLMYLGYVLKKKANVISKCKNIKNYLDIVGVDPALYMLTYSPNISFIETIHAPELDSYGFKAKMGDNLIVYTGDTSTLQPFKEHLKDADEFYVDVSKFGGVHLKIDNVFEELISIQNKGVKVYLMHLDDEEYISNLVQDRIEFAQF